MVLIQKWPFFQLFFLGNMGQKNVFYNILEWKNAFLGYENKKFQKIEKLTFFQRFWSKNGQFFNCFFFRQYRQKNVFYDILEWKNAFLGYKNKKFKKWKNWHFSKGANPWFWSKNGHFSKFSFPFFHLFF